MNTPEMDPTFNNYNEAGDTAPIKAHLENLRLRDYFAGLAMQASLSTGFIMIDNAPEDRQRAEHARVAYAQADAMMEARKQ